MPFRRKGSSNWYINIKGVRRSAETSNEADAKALEDRLNHEAWLHKKMGIKPPRSWKEAVVRWSREKQGKVTLWRDVRMFNYLDAHLGHITDLNQITRDRVDAIMQLRGVSGEPSSANSTANRYMVLIGSVLATAEREWGWENRTPRLRRYKEPEAGSAGRALTVEEWGLLVKELPIHLRLAATFAVSTGLREAKVFGLKWSMLSGNASLAFAGTGNKIGNSIPMNATAIQVLSACRSAPIVSPEYVFLYEGHRMRRHGEAWNKAVKRAGIGHVRWHDLRVTFNSWLAQNGVPEQIQKRLVGHATSGVHDRYTKLAVEHLRPFSEIIDTVLAQEDASERLNANAISR